MTQSPSSTAPVYNARKVNELLQLDYSEEKLKAFDDSPAALKGYVTFFDPGWSIHHFGRAFSENRVLWKWQNWYYNQAFGRLEESPCYRQLRIEAAKASFGKTFAEQQAMVPPDEEIPLARVVVTWVVLYFLDTGDALFPEYWVRCRDEISDGRFARVGGFNSDGLRVQGWMPYNARDDLGVVSARKL